jgi:polar amino acid transport system substrate-binding protein
MNKPNLVMTITAVIIGAIFLITVLGQKFFPREPLSTPETSSDKLAVVLQRGTLIVSTDPAYPLQSDLIEGARRAAPTNCTSDQYTAAELGGFDIEVAVEVATRLGVEACFVTPAWESVVSGHWADQWDISVGSIAITPERMGNLYFTQPYYTTPAAFFVHQENSTYRQLSDLSDKSIGVCGGCTYESYLDSSLNLPGQAIDVVVENPAITSYATDSMALNDLTMGDGMLLDAVLTAQPTGQAWISVGKPLKQVGEPVFIEYLAAAVDKYHRADPIPLVKRVSDIVQEMHRDGTLGQLSQKYYRTDLTAAAAQFKLETLEQFP